MRRSIPAAVAVFLLTATAAAVAAEPELGIEDGVLRLELEDAIELALERNLSLAVERYRTAESEYSLTSARSIFDTQLTAGLNAFEDSAPQASQLDGAEVSLQERLGWDLNLSQLVATGGTASLDFNNSRFETNSQFATLNPSYRSDFDLSFRQPLLRDLGRLATERNVLIARSNLAISEENLEARVLDTLVEVVNGYWNLVEARQQLEVAEESLALAEQLHEQNRIRVEVGTMAPLELVQSEAGVATRVEEIIIARARVGDSADRLRQLLNLSEPRHWDLELVPMTQPESAAAEIDLEDSIRRALELRPTVRAQRLAQEILERDVRYFKNQRLPRLDLALTYGYNGLGGDITERDFFTGEILRQAAGGYSDAIDQLTGGDFDGWTVALNLAYPLQNRLGQSQHALAEVAFERGEAELRDLELAVTTEVRRLARGVDAARQTLESARVSRRLAEKNLEAEQKRYDNGMSTSFRVLEIQEDLSQARSRLVNAVTGYRKALALFYRATGGLLDELAVEIDGGKGTA